MSIFNPKNYVSTKDIIKALIPAYNNPDLIKDGSNFMPKINMLYRESITAVITQAIFIELFPNFEFYIKKYETPKEGDGHIDMVTNKGKFKVIEQSVVIEQVYASDFKRGDTTEIIKEVVEGKICNVKTDRSKEVLVIFVDRDSTLEGGIDIKKIKDTILTNPDKFDFYILIVLGTSDYLCSYTYIVTDLDPQKNNHRRIAVKVDLKTLEANIVQIHSGDPNF